MTSRSLLVIVIYFVFRVYICGRLRLSLCIGLCKDIISLSHKFTRMTMYTLIFTLSVLTFRILTMVQIRLSYTFLCFRRQIIYFSFIVRFFSSSSLCVTLCSIHATCSTCLLQVIRALRCAVINLYEQIRNSF